MDQKVWDPEWGKFEDRLTGAAVTRLTGLPCINHPLYYLANSFSSGGRWLVFASDRAGKTDLYRVSLQSGEIHRLTDLSGVQPFSGNVVDDQIYFATDGQLRRLALETDEDYIFAERPGCGLAR